MQSHIDVTVHKSPEARREATWWSIGLVGFLVVFLIGVAALVVVYLPRYERSDPRFWHDDTRSVSCWIGSSEMVCIPDSQLD